MRDRAAAAAGVACCRSRTTSRSQCSAGPRSPAPRCPNGPISTSSSCGPSMRPGACAPARGATTSASACSTRPSSWPRRRVICSWRCYATSSSTALVPVGTDDVLWSVSDAALWLVAGVGRLLPDRLFDVARRRGRARARAGRRDPRARSRRAHRGARRARHPRAVRGAPRLPGRAGAPPALNRPVPSTAAPLIRGVGAGDRYGRAVPESPAAPVPPTDLSTTCLQCGALMREEHAHYRCPECGWRDSCCDGPY